MFTKNTITQSMIDTVNGILAEEDKKALLLEPEKKTPFAKSYKPSNSVKEAAEELDELSKKTLGSYINKAVGTEPQRGHKSSVVNSVRAANSARADYMQGGSDMDSLDKKVNAADKNFSNRLSGIKSATRKLTKEEELDEAEKEISFTGSHQAKTTLKNIKNPSVQQRMAAHDIKPGIAGYRDRIAMYKDAEHKGNLKSEEKEISFTGSHQGKTTLGHIKNPTVQQRMAAHDIKPGIKGYRDRIAMYKDAEHMGNLKSEEKGEGSHEDEKQDKALFKKMYKKAEKQDDKSEKKMSEERHLSPKEGAEKERIAKGMKKSASGFKARYGNRAKSVIYATATKLAKEEVEQDNPKLSALHKRAQEVSKQHGVVQHINKNDDDNGHHISDWYDDDKTVASYNKGKLREAVDEQHFGNEMHEAREYLAVHPKTDKIEHISNTKGGRDEFIKSKGGMHKPAQTMAGQKKVGDKFMRERTEQIDEDEEMTQKKKEQVVTVKHKDSGKELRVVKPAVADYQKRGYYPVKEQGVAEGSDQELVNRQGSYWDQVAKEKKNKERDALKDKKAEHEKTPIGKAEKYWAKEEVEELDEISTKTLAMAAHYASDPDSDYSYGKSHDAQKFADHAKKTKDAKSAAAVQGAADAKGHYPRDNHTQGYDKIAGRQMRSATPSMVTKKGVLTKTAVQGLKSSLRKEEVEELDELNKDTLYSYARKSEKDQDNQFNKIGKALRDKDPETGNKAGHKFSMRSIGQNRAEKRLEKEEVEGLDELNDTEESATINKNTKTVDDLGGRKKVPATFDNEHKSYKVKLETVTEGKGPETDSVPFVKNANTSSSPMGLAKELAQKSFKKIRNETMMGTASATSEEKKK